jgi:hypothetical protein
LLLALCFGLLSCKKEFSTPQVLVPSFTGISVTNAALVSGSLNFFIDDQAVQLPDSLTYGTTALFTLSNNPNPSNPLSGYTPYLSVNYGYRNLTVRMPGINNNLVNVGGYFEPGAKYSLFIADSLTHGQLQYVLLQDKYGFPDSTECQLRFLNLSPDAPPMDLWAFWKAGQYGTRIFTNSPFIPYNSNTIPQVQAFSSIKAGPYYFIAAVSGTSNILLQGGLFLQGGSVVTIYAKGLVYGKGTNQLDVGVIQYLP